MKPRFGEERWDFLPSLHGRRVGEKSLGASTLQAAEPPYSVNNGPIKQIWKTNLQTNYGFFICFLVGVFEENPDSYSG